MDHDTLLALPHAPLLTALFCALDDGGLNEAARAVYQIRRVEADLLPAEREWFASLLHLHLSFIGAEGGRA